MSYIHQKIIDQVFEIAVQSANDYYELIYNMEANSSDIKNWLPIFCEFLTVYIVLVSRYFSHFNIDEQELENLGSYIFTHSFLALFPKMPEFELEEFASSYMIESNTTKQFHYSPYKEIYPNPETHNYNTVMGQFSDRMIKITSKPNPVYWFTSRELATKKFLELLKKYKKD